ncbi:MAG: hypothetical protein M0042_07560 [Nitrospiraceae bacterium]|nr:hypothetical protein [Nitrospiraceae bacterium]
MRRTMAAVLIAGIVALLPLPAWAGSCCGGGSAAGLVLPKFAQSMIDMSFDVERYNGFWNQDGDYLHDPPGTDLRQYRLNLGYAQRLAKRWQATASVPYIWNDTTYSGLSSRTSGIGDMALGVWYEAFDATVCRLGWDDLSFRDLAPAATFGLALTVPTGISPYDNVNSSFDITGRGFYRLDANMLLDKTIIPFGVSFLMSYGKAFERPVDREYGQYVQPYRKQLGDRATGSLAVSYIQYLDIGSSRRILTYTAAFSEVWEGESRINGSADPTSGFRKSSVTGTFAFSTLDRCWTVKASWNHSITSDGWGSNFPLSDIYSLGVSRAFE